MNPKQLQLETLLFVAMAKMLSEQSTVLIGELQRETKMRFNNVVKPAEVFIKHVESTISEFDKETLTILTDSLHDGIAGLRKELLTIEK